jgi:hypothetical protein
VVAPAARVEESMQQLGTGTDCLVVEQVCLLAENHATLYLSPEKQKHPSPHIECYASQSEEKKKKKHTSTTTQENHWNTNT